MTTADDAEAYLGIESEGDVSGTQLRGDSDPLRVGTLHNNAGADLEVRSVVVDSIGDDTVNDDIVTIAAPNPGRTIERNDSTAVTIECNDDTTVGEQEIVVRVARVTGTGISIAEPTFTATVDIQCGKGKFSGSADLNVSDVGTGDTTQTVSFDVGAVKNKDEVTIDFSNPQQNGGVDYSGVTDGDLTVQSQGHGGTVAFDSETSRLTYSPQGNEDGTITIEISGIDVVGNPGESYPVSYSDTTGRDDGDFFDIT
ncbi:hypothetical protein [Haloterrigena alkaliphila]|uniref:Uncharacterized protein n=1 Tax=Haloterrigena alkaliphila TaxID=2816475 RepID=A0A8A2VIT1_9EURY|nr:hypothetical protein [Haloterrigena alkaliphila]QSX00376.1 hypothetical protein J0X25_05255 [Haloterrigena alkaliphila]